jgi:hypothetical protein
VRIAGAMDGDADPRRGSRAWRVSTQVRSGDEIGIDFKFA